MVVRLSRRHGRDNREMPLVVKKLPNNLKLMVVKMLLMVGLLIVKGAAMLIMVDD